MIIAVDGTAGSGKGSFSKVIAKKYDLSYLETGKLYRAVAYKLIKHNIKSNNQIKEKAISISKTFSIEDLNLMNSDSLLSVKVSSMSSLVATFPEVRKSLLSLQRNFTKNCYTEKFGCILDGRDIGTVVVPNADIKFFLDASPKIRAKRRTLELIEKGKKALYTDILQNIIERDNRDKKRKISPLIIQKDAFFIDTSDKSLEEVTKFAFKKIDSFIEKTKNIN